MRVALLFDHFGPYHHARLRAAGQRLDVTGLEFRARSREYAWEPGAAEGLPIVTVPEGDAGLSSTLQELLTKLDPEVVAIPGWSSPEALAALCWCLNARVPAVLMSESCAHDEPRRGWKEWVKRRIVRLFSAALVGGSLHCRYLEDLGMESLRVFLGYDAVDNAYFKEGAERALAEGLVGAVASENTGSFLASARFIEKKNLPRLLDAYAAYRIEVSRVSGASFPWKLTLLGDGELRATLQTQVHSLGLEKHVSMPGFLQYADLPRHYARASAFIHASTTEQWGLVVNEAMASGLPVLLSNRCGCAPDLVREGVNGFTFDPNDTQGIAAAMVRVTALSADERTSMALSSASIIENWGPERFGHGLEQAAASARSSPLRRAGLIDRVLLFLLSRR